METVGDILETLPGAGHNKAPLAEVMIDQFEVEHGDLLQRMAALQAMVERMPETIQHSETAARFSDTLKLLAAVAKVAEEARKIAKAPALSMGRLVDGFFNDRLLDQVEKIDKPLRERLVTWLKTNGGSIRGEHSLTTLQPSTEFDQLNRAELDLEALRQHLPTDALERAIRSFIKAGGRELRGVRIFENQKARVS